MVALSKHTKQGPERAYFGEDETPPKHRDKGVRVTTLVPSLSGVSLEWDGR